MNRDSTREFYSGLHSLRGAAALWVLLLHVWVFSGSPAIWLSPFFSLGWLGVHVFYCLSAFLLTSQHLTRPPTRWSYVGFVARRLLRILPAYYAQLLLLALVGYQWVDSMSASQLVAHLLMWFHWPLAGVQPLNGVWWTLPVELTFYLILPLLARLLTAVNRLIFISVMVAVTLGYRALVIHWSSGDPTLPFLVGQFPGVIVIFATGMVAADLYRTETFRRAMENRSMRVLSLVGIAIWCWLLLKHSDRYWSGSPLVYFWDGVSALLIATLIAATASRSTRQAHDRTKRPAISTLMSFLGDVSYGLYLWHLPIAVTVAELIPPQLRGGDRFVILLLCVLPLSLIAAWASYALIEVRANKLGRQFGAQLTRR